MIPHDPLLATPSILVVPLLALESGLRFGRRVYLRSLRWAVLCVVAAILLRAAVTDIGFPLETVWMCLFAGFISLYGHMLVCMIQQYQQQLEWQSRSDSLTGLLNRRGLREATTALLAHGLSKSESLAVLYGDLNGFKAINDNFGHARGDRMLVDVAQAMQNSLRDYDVLARCGGDEFAVFMPDTSEAAAQLVSQRLTEVVAELGQQQGLNVGISLGLAMAPQDGRDLEALLKVADQAMYEVKRASKGNASVLSRAAEALAGRRSR